MAPDAAEMGERLVRIELEQDHLRGYIKSEKEARAREEDAVREVIERGDAALRLTHSQDVADIRSMLREFTEEIGRKVEKIANAIQGTNERGEPTGLVHKVDVLERAQAGQSRGMIGGFIGLVTVGIERLLSRLGVMP